MFAHMFIISCFSEMSIGKKKKTGSLPVLKRNLFFSHARRAYITFAAGEYFTVAEGDFPGRYVSVSRSLIIILLIRHKSQLHVEGFVFIYDERKIALADLLVRRVIRMRQKRQCHFFGSV